MAGELVTGYLRLVPTVQGIQGATARALMPATKEADAAGLTSGKAFGLSVSNGMKRAVKGGLAGGALFAGVVAKKGIDRLLGIEDARASLAGLGHDAADIDRIMTNALDSVRGTAFGMADAGKVAASAVAAGIKPGKALTENLKLIADASTIAKTDMGSMGAIFNKVAASGKVQGDVLAQLGDMGIPIVQLLSKELGVSAEDTVMLASKGKINFAQFSRAMQDGLGGAALKSGETTRGAWANMNASLGRIGANLLTGLFPRVKGGFQSITTFLVPLEDKAASFGSSLNDAFSGVAGTIDKVKSTLGTLDFDNIDGAKLGASLSEALGVALSSLGDLAGKVFDTLGDVMGKVDWIGLGITVGTQTLPFALGLVTGLINGITDPGLWAGIWEHLPEILMAAIAVAFLPSKIAGPLVKILERIPLVGRFLGWIVKSLQRIGTGITGYAKGFVRSFWEKLTAGLSMPGGSLLGRILGGLSGLFGRVMAWLGLLPTRIGLFGLRIAEGLGTGLRNGIPKVLGFLASIPGRILRAVGALARLLFPKGVEAISGLVSGLRGRMGAAVGFARSIPSKVKGAIKGAGSLLKGIGGNIVDGLVKGLGAAWHKVTDWLSKKIGALSGAAKKVLGIKSPSRVFAEIGQNVGAGLAKGMVGSTPLVERASADMVRSAIPAGAGVGTVAAARATVPPPTPAAASSSGTGSDYTRFHPDDLRTLAAIVSDNIYAGAGVVVGSQATFSNRLTDMRH